MPVRGQGLVEARREVQTRCGFRETHNGSMAARSAGYERRVDGERVHTVHLVRIFVVAVFELALCIGNSSRVAAQPAAAVSAASASTSTPKPASAARKLDLTNQLWRGDFDAMLTRHIVRVLVPYSRTLYVNDRGQERGLTADFATRIRLIACLP